MKAAKLTDLRVKNAKPKAGRYEISDNGSGFRVIVYPSGSKSYATRLWFNGKQIKVVHGHVAMLSLHDARSASADAIKQAKNGNDPTKAKKIAKQQREIAKANTFEAVALLYLKSKFKLRTLHQIEDRLTRLAFPHLGSKPIADIRRSQIVAALDQIEHANGATMATRVLSDISGVLHFHAKRSDDYVVPLVKGMGRITPSQSARDRILTDAEIRAVWNAGNRFANFLLLTAARRDEVASMQWKEIEGSDWTLPAVRNKVGKDLIRPLSKAAMALLPPRGADDEFVFGNTPNKARNDFGKLKRRLDAASGVTNWRLHDLRRTARTLLSRASISADHAERCLGHVIGGVRGIYDKFEFKAEKGFAFEALARLISTIVDPPEGNVSQFKRARV